GAGAGAGEAGESVSPMVQRGVSAWGGPIHCDDDPIEFIDHWIRMSWAQTLCGRRFNQTGDTFGWYLAHLVAVDAIRATHRPRHCCIDVAGEVDIHAGVHTCPELSQLRPGAVFELQTVETTLLFRAEVRRTGSVMRVETFSVDPTAKDYQPYRQRFGGPEIWYTWSSKDVPGVLR
ncbi:MAG: hypothetical protein ACIAQU_05035, partial [Phycisphaerales bacterium JB064]